MIQKKKFQLSFKDILKKEQKSSLEQIVHLKKNLDVQENLYLMIHHHHHLYLMHFVNVLKDTKV